MSDPTPDDPDRRHPRRPLHRPCRAGGVARRLRRRATWRTRSSPTTGSSSPWPMPATAPGSSPRCTRRARCARPRRPPSRRSAPWPPSCRCTAGSTTRSRALPLEACPPDTRRFVEHTLRDFRRAGVDKDPADPGAAQGAGRPEREAGAGLRPGHPRGRALGVARPGPARRPAGGLRGRPPAGAGREGADHHRLPRPPPLPAVRRRRRGAPAALRGQHLARLAAATSGFSRQLLAVRAEQARLLGAASWADHITGDKMARSAATVAGVPGAGGDGGRGPGGGGSPAPAAAQAAGRPRRDARSRTGRRPSTSSG